MDPSEREKLKKAVFDIVKLIPYGRATSYGAIAKAIGWPNISRLVGKFMGECSDKNIPAHKVVNSQGKLTGKEAFDEDTMIKLLNAEGINVQNDKIVHWKKVFWDPFAEIDIKKH